MPVMKTWDIESTIRSSFKRKANPFDPANWVVTHAWKDKGGSVQEVRFGASRPPAGWLKPVLSNCALLVGFNIKFDLLHALQDSVNLEAWMDWVANGGNVWDCQLAEYLLEGMTQANHMLSLDEVAPRYGGNVKVDEVKALWEAGVNTHEIEPALLTRYLCGGPDEHGVFQMGDVENTEQIAVAQIARAREAGQLNSILMNMGALLFTVEAERNGMFVDKVKGMEIAEGLKARIAGLAEALQFGLPPLPEGFEFNWNSSKQKSALLFGGSIPYRAREYQQQDGTFSEWPNLQTQAYAQMDVVAVTPETYGMTDFQKETLAKLVIPGTDGMIALEDAKRGGIPVVRYAGGKNAGEVKTKKVKVPDRSKPKARFTTRQWHLDGLTKPDPAWASSTPGVYSTSGAVIDAIGDRGIPFLKTLKEFSALQKDLGTYYISQEFDDDGNLIGEKGMLTMVDEQGIIHHKLNMTNTVTARLSASDPNLQNLSKGNKSDVKYVFVSRFTEGFIIQSDFSSLEIYVQANLTRCQQLIADLRAGLDLHCVRLAAKEHMPYEEVVKLAKGYKLPDGTKVEAEKEWDYKRTGAKQYSFQRAYGAGVPKIAASTGMTEEEVQALADAEDARYPEIPAYYAALTDEIKSNRRPTSRVIPHPEVPGILCHLGTASIRTPDGKRYTFTESPSPAYLAKRGTFASFSPTEIKNYPVQGAGGEWMKAAMTLMVRVFYKFRNFGGRALIVNTVHDASYVDAAADVALEAARWQHACMVEASTYMEQQFKWKIDVPVPSDTVWGSSMMEEKAVPALMDGHAERVAQIRALFIRGYTPSWEQ